MPTHLRLFAVSFCSAVFWLGRCFAVEVCEPLNTLVERQQDGKIERSEVIDCFLDAGFTKTEMKKELDRQEKEYFRPIPGIFTKLNRKIDLYNDHDFMDKLFENKEFTIVIDNSESNYPNTYVYKNGDGVTQTSSDMYVRSVD